ncbi:MAG TPA: 23S rRNA (adenine(2503)-C(2))-methyltransferase RlmN [Candidatus Acidoferrales bacterium]|nr:23S rRNA (adenine(2503)-C(2))-methyltransferase RlmN [Candidatus Acidoferrales bacterium]
MSSPRQFELLGLDSQELASLAQVLGEPAYRARQLSQALYRERVSDISAITTLSVSLRERLAAQGYVIGLPEVERRFVSVDGTVRYLFRFRDGQTVETVWMPEGDGGERGDGSEAGEEEERRPSDWDRATICVSSQVGCAVNCRFCMTAQLGAVRNLTAGEIVGQILAVLNDHGVEVDRRRVNLVFMGQGEPFLNYDNFMKAVRLLVAEVGIPEPRMTVSTSGIVPRIADFATESVRPKLAISLNGSNDDVRERVMPINRKWNIGTLLDVLRGFPLRPRERLTFEYVLLAGVNDGEQNAREVAALLRGLNAKVNLIALNPGPEIPFSMPSSEAVDRFQQILMESGIRAFVRRPRGRDIYAACGQLKRTTELVELRPA